MKVIKFPVGSEPELVEVENSSRALQELVGGRIQFVRTEPDMGLLVNEEAQYRKQFNTWHSRFGTLYGTIVLVGIAGNEFCDVPQDYICSVFGEDNHEPH